MEEKLNDKQQEAARPDFTAPVEDIARAGKEYVDLRLDQVKLSAVEGLSLGLGRFLSGLLIIILVSFCITLVTLALVLVFGKLIGNYALAASIAAGLAILVTVVAFCLRKTMFVNGFVRLFTNIFFGDEENK